LPEKTKDPRKKAYPTREQRDSFAHALLLESTEFVLESGLETVEFLREKARWRLGPEEVA
jgi:hypothetical protein